MRCAPSSLVDRLAERLERAGLSPFPFQREAWQALAAAEALLILAPTGAGKTLAALGGFLLRALAAPPRPGLRLLWVTPLRALAADTARAADAALSAAEVGWRVVLRTGDVAATAKRRARAGEAELLITTPESLALLLSHASFQQACAGLWGVVCDEWHELIGSKRGVLVELALARLRRLSPGLKAVALSASLADPQTALAVLAPGREGRIVRAENARPLRIETLLPLEPSRLPWSGHLGLGLLPALLPRLLQAENSLVFTNTRAQAEQWHAAIASVWPRDTAELALHHGSLAPERRAAVEEGLQAGRLRVVVATSSLELGVDLPRVEQVVQIGSPKGIARLVQRAGRARHRPGEPAELLFLPTNAWELVEIAAARAALAAGRMEARAPLRLSLDVLAQHLTTLALSGPLDPAEVLAEVQTTHAFADLGAEAFEALLQMLERGGSALARYPGFARLRRCTDGRFEPASPAVVRDHRLAIGTIIGDDLVSVLGLNGRPIGEVEGRFLARLRPSDRFRLGGELLELVVWKDDRAWVRKARGSSGAVPRWMGGRMPLSVELGEALLSALREVEGPELQAVRPMLALQAELSALPRPGELLCECLHLSEGWHLFLYPFAGRELHAGLAALLASRLSVPPLEFAVNDYGLLLIFPEAPPLAELAFCLAHPPQPSELEPDERLEGLRRRRFHENALIAGLIRRAPAGAVRSQRQLRLSSRLLYEVLSRHDPQHPMLRHAHRETLEQDLALLGLMALLSRLQAARLLIHHPARLTPLGFPLCAERLRTSLDPRAAERLLSRLAAEAVP
jgi:ATP-dependent Lhr-like helicase